MSQLNRPNLQSGVSVAVSGELTETGLRLSLISAVSPALHSLYQQNCNLAETGFKYKINSVNSSH